MCARSDIAYEHAHVTKVTASACACTATHLLKAVERTATCRAQLPDLSRARGTEPVGSANTSNYNHAHTHAHTLTHAHTNATLRHLDFRGPRRYGHETAINAHREPAVPQLVRAAVAQRVSAHAPACMQAACHGTKPGRT